jgi:hypothetical protein
MAIARWHEALDDEAREPLLMRMGHHRRQAAG